MQQNQNVFSFGELLIRLNSAAEDFLEAGNNVSMFPGGSEANVATLLGQWNVPVSYVTAAPDNTLAQNALDKMKQLGVDTSKVIVEGSRLGLYFLLSPNGLTNGEVVYDRKFSSFSSIKPGSIDWDTLLSGYTWFHWSALTPGLNSDLAIVILEGLKVARAKGLTVSVDLNYRSRLWDYGKTPLEVMPELASYCDVIMGNIWAANKMLGTKVSDDLNRQTSAEVYFEHAKASAREIFEQYPQCKHIANTFRFIDNPEHNLFYGTYHTNGADVISDVLETNEVVDRIGSGDAFMAGLIYSLINKLEPQETLNNAVKAGFDKLFVKGDFLDTSIKS
ncbi:MAG: sugar kinase [Pedobacter sp.]|nr:MAG: sugar kinase [Pedobacter sp.]